MHVKSNLRNAVRCAGITVAAFVLMGMDGCDLLYRYVQCVISGECTELVPELFSFPPEPPPPPPATRDQSVPAAAGSGSRFGAALAAPSVAGTVRLVVGAPEDATDLGTTGAVYVYASADADAAEPARLVPSDGTSGMRFGASVAVEGSGTAAVVVVGAPGAEPSGAAYVFEWTGSAWEETARFSPDDGSTYSEFGAAVALVDAGSASERLAVVGAPSRSDGGSVSVYRKSGASPWAADVGGGHVASIQPSGVESDEHFGASLASAEGFLAVGAPQRGGYFGAGAAYLFRYDATTGAWTESPTRMEPEDAPSQAQFGTSVAITTTTGATTPTVLVAAPGGGYDGLDGTVWSFLRAANGTLARRRFAAAGPGFGAVVAADPRRAAVALGSPEGYGDRTFAVNVFAPAEFDQTVSYGRPLRGDGSRESMQAFGAAVVVRLSADGGTAVVDVGAPGEGDTGRVYHYVLPQGRADAKRAAPKPEGNRYMAFRADAARPGTGTAQVLTDLPLRAPFRTEVAVGSFAPDRREGLIGGSIAFRLDLRGADPASFALLRANFRESGLEVSSETQWGEEFRRVSMPSEWVADLAIECDGSMMQLWARPRGVEEWQFVTSESAGPGTWTASIVIEGIDAGSEVGMDEPRLVANAAPGDDAPPAETAADRIYAAIDREMATSAALDRRDLPAALLLADAAKARLAEAKAAVALIPSKAKPPATGPKAALRHIAAATRDLAKARALIQRKKRTAQILPKLSRSLTSSGRALAALRS